MGRLISEKYAAWQAECEARFQQLKKNEEELNRIFIDIYGLQDELTPDVADKDVTVHRVFDSKDDMPESMKGSNYVRTMRDEIVSLISYAVGCMFGRYSLDVDGLAYAGGEWDASKYKTIIPDSDNIIPICDDEYFDDDIADLAFPELKEYKKVVSADDLRELRKAIGLHAQGIGIGAFVYVRRIFERLIDRAKDMAITDGSLDMEEYSHSRVAERIDLLKKYLPNALVSNKAFYGIVSKGIHELSEEDCIAYFPVVQEGIMLILRQWKAKQEEIETEQRLSASLSKIATNLSKGGNN